MSDIILGHFYHPLKPKKPIVIIIIIIIIIIRK